MKAKIALGFNIYLEHQLHYEKIEEKGRVKIPPLVQLGGGAWNMAKTLGNLSNNGVSPVVIAISSKQEGPESSAVRFLLQRESTIAKLLPLKERMPSSFYLMPRGGKTWAFGDPGGKVKQMDQRTATLLKQTARWADIKVVTEVSDEKEELRLTRMLLKKFRPHQVSVLLPSVKLLKSSSMVGLCREVDCLAFNEAEARILFGENPTKENLLNFPVPHIFLTRGSGVAWFKAGNRIVLAKPRTIANPKFIAGAGDAALAALVLAYFVERRNAEDSVKYAMRVGRATLLRPEPYFTG